MIAETEGPLQLFEQYDNLLSYDQDKFKIGTKDSSVIYDLQYDENMGFLSKKQFALKIDSGKFLHFDENVGYTS